MFCTSTLLEGVNLPAKNIFIFSNKIGNSNFSNIDFWNLAGRAGRLSKELSGNIICVRINNKKNVWNNPKKDLEIVRNKKIDNVKPNVMTGKLNFYKNLERSLENQNFTKKNPSQSEKEIWNQYANIVLIHQVSKTDSILMSNFLKKNNEGEKILDKVGKNNNIPIKILEQCSSIKVLYQNKVWNSINENEQAFPVEINVKSCHDILLKMYDYYNWAEEESGGRNPMAKTKSRLEYFAVLMYDWMKATPLNLIITNLIKYYKKKGYIWYRNQYIEFKSETKEHINILINDLISDIDNILRFKIKNYFLNYYLIVSFKNGKVVAGVNWTDYLEYGTTDSAIIELQNIGLPRHLSILIKKEYNDCLVFEENNLVDFNYEKLLSEFDRRKYHDEYEELKNLCI